MNKRTLQSIRVPLGFIFAAVLLIFAIPTVTSLVAGSIVAAVGLLIRAWASGHIRKAATLAVTGPYAYTRNPLYLGSLFLAIGFSIAGGVWWLPIVGAALFLGIYIPVLSVEADDMRQQFHSEYDEYAAHVPILVPRATPWRRGDGKWDSGLYLQYREYRAALGAAGIIAILAAESAFFL